MESSSTSTTRTRFRDQNQQAIEDAADSETSSGMSSLSSDLDDQNELQSMTGKGITHLCSELLELKAESEEDFHKNIFSNYSSFVRESYDEDDADELEYEERGRDGDVHPVLKPVENLDQWKAVKSKGSTPLKLQKENLSLEQEVSVDASLSNWLSSRETTPAKKSSTFEAYTPERSI
ncbi:Peptide transporter PTR3-A [Hibiscus syriacus]|uniref:Peptide transporter PTR3-A n=1 Tax=Hibiscus syriacus TaxID=106335 RepID=A0A6A2YBG9_HIBSY|nr:Peptide transporter PTR3-A [Hibiscus syriacus]